MPVSRHFAFFGEIHEGIDAGLVQSRQPLACHFRVGAGRVFAGQYPTGNDPVGIRERSIHPADTTSD